MEKVKTGNIIEKLKCLVDILKESENERIVESLINIFDTYFKETYLEETGTKQSFTTWLEKQGEQKTTDLVPQEANNKLKPRFLSGQKIKTKDGQHEDMVLFSDTDGFYVLKNLGRMYLNEDEWTFADDEEPVEKVRFREGDWIINKHTLKVSQVAYVNEHGDSCTLNDENQTCISGSRIDDYRLWTIEDAKNGDVLIDCCDEYKNPLIFILKRFEKVDFGLAQKSDYSSYCFLTMSDKPRFKEGYFHHMNDIKPATKSQRDLLFSKMKEAGYRWDDKKKEIYKVVIDEGKSEMDRNFTEMMLKGEQKSDNVKPKFNIGDWGIDNEDGTIFQIVKVLDNTYTYKTNEGKEYSCTHYSLENDARLWSIADAKDGDVLATDDGICIFNGTLEEGKYPFAYCGITKRGFDSYNVNLPFSNDNNIHPATKEQCDILEEAMTNAGYRWNKEEKKLEKIEQKPTEWTEDRNKELSLSLQIQSFLTTCGDELYAKGKPYHNTQRVEEINRCKQMWVKLHNAYFYNQKDSAECGEKDEEYIDEDYGIDGLYNAQRILEKTLGEVEGYQSDDGILEHKCAINAVKKVREQKHVDNPKETEYSTMLQVIWGKVCELEGKLGDIYKIVSEPYRNIS